MNYIRADCPLLRFSGLMSMGALHDIEGFKTMAALRDSLITDDLTNEKFVLSMGTSADY